MVLALAVIIAVCAAASPNEVTALPGWQQPLPSRQFSGFLDVGGQRRLHYILVESEGNPSQDPVVIWFNGGPGCSSLIGYMTEQGPFFVNDNQTLALNAHRWNLISNMVFLEAPAGVGFSYQVGANSSFRYVTNDTQTSADNLAAVLAFLKEYPQYLDRDLYLTGESYAGIYVPLLAQQIYLYNRGSATPKINLRGIAVGNGAVASGQWYEDGLVKQRMQFFYDHGLFSTTLYNQILSECGSFSARSAPCSGLLNQMAKQVGPLSIYDIRVTCGEQPERLEELLVAGMSPQGPMTLRDDPCLDTDNAVAYLNTKAAQAALHVEAGAAAVGPWAPCSGNIAYTRIPMDERTTVYPDLIGRYRVLIYNGDQDNCIPYTQDEAWTRAYGLAVVRDWHPWMVDNQVAGYATQFQRDFSFVTVKGAGHMVPEYQPARALVMLRSLLSGTPL